MAHVLAFELRSDAVREYLKAGKCCFMGLRRHLQRQMANAKLLVGPQSVHDRRDAAPQAIASRSGWVVQDLLRNPIDGAGDAHGEDGLSRASPTRPSVTYIADACLKSVERHRRGVPAIPQLGYPPPRSCTVPTYPDGRM